MGALSDRRVTVIPSMKLPLRCTLTHCTTGSLPITVQANRVVPVALVGEWAIVDFSDRIFTAPGLRRLFAFSRAPATHAGLRRQPASFRTIPSTSPLVCAWINASSSSRSTFSTDRYLANRALIARNTSTPSAIRMMRFRAVGSGGSGCAGAYLTAEHTGHRVRPVQRCNRIER